MSFQQDIQEDSFSSDEDFDDEEEDTDSSNADEKVAQDDIFDEEFIKCYAALKRKGSSIYSADIKFFSNTEHPAKEMSTKEPKMSLLDHQLTVDNDAVEESDTKKHDPLRQSFISYDQELDEIKKSLVEASADTASDSDDELLVVKKLDGKAGLSNEKPPPTRKKVTTLLDKLEKEGDEDVSHLKQIWSDPEKLSEDDRFLRDYIINKRYITSNVGDEKPGKGGFFSKNLDELSDVEDEDDYKNSNTKHIKDHHSEEKDFDKIARVPRNSTNTIRDLVEKQQKKEKRLKKMEKIKKKKEALKDADFEDFIGDLPTKFHYEEIEPVDYGMTAEEILLASDDEEDLEVEKEKAIREPSTSKRKRKRKRKMNRQKFAKTGVAPDRLLAYGLSKSKLKKSRLL